MRAGRPAASAAVRATSILEGWAMTRGDRSVSSLGCRLTTQPVTTTIGSRGSPSAWRTALRVLDSASPVTAQVLMTMMSASS